MRIVPINNQIFYRSNNSVAPLTKKQCEVSFGQHPDFVELSSKYEALRASSYFRRGGYFNGPSEKFIDVIDSLKLFFSEKMNPEKNGKVQMLIGGLAESQEPFSYLAVIKNIIGKQKLQDVMDLYTVDLQSAPDKKEFFLQSFYDDNWEPEFVPDSFVKEESAKYGYKYWHRYRVKDEILSFLQSVYDNPEKAKWETRLQDAVKEYPDNSLDIVSINNTIMYVNDYEEGMNILKNVFRAMKLNGIFITDPDNRSYKKIFTPDVANEIYPGIYQKLKILI